MRNLKPYLKRVGGAALSQMTEAEMRADPAKAFRLANDAMRHAYKAVTGEHTKGQSDEA